jgi:PEP-CTERM motif
VTSTSGGSSYYVPGDILTVTISGNSEGLTSAFISLILTFDPSLSLVSSTAGVLADSDPNLFWQQTAFTGTCGLGGYAPNECRALDAYEYVSFGGVPIDLLPSTFSTFQFDTSSAPGIFEISVEPCTYPVGTHSFFDLPGKTIIWPIPEPTTAALLGLGLAALGVARRQRPR